MTTDIWLMGALSSLVSILVSTGLSQFIRHRGEQRQALLFMKADIERSRRLLELWQQRPTGADWNGRGPVFPPLTSIDRLGASIASLSPNLVRNVRNVDLLVPKLIEDCALVQKRFDQIRFMSAIGGSVDADRAACVREWDQLVKHAIEMFIETEAEISHELSRLNRRVLFGPV